MTATPTQASSENLIATWGNRWNQFFYSQEVPYGLALVRILITLTVLGSALPRWIVSRELYSTDGATAPIAANYGYDNFLPEFSGGIVVILSTLMTLSLCTALVGWRTRFSLALAGATFTYLCMLDYASTLAKFSVIMTHTLLLLACSNCGAVWSVDAWLAGRKPRNWQGTVIQPRFTAWPRRLLQILISVVYLGAALTKLQTPGFLTGDQLQAWMMTHINLRHPFGEDMAMYPVLVTVGCYVAMVWEILFIFLVWRGPWRAIILTVGVLFHLMTTLTLGLLLFPMTCYAVYCAFIEEDDVRRVAAWWRRAVRQSRWLRESFVRPIRSLHATCAIARPVSVGSQRLVFVALLLVGCLLGLFIEHRLDVYGKRRAEGPHQLVALDPQLVRQMLAPTQPVRNIDWFQFIDTGSILAGDHLLLRQRTFGPGQTVIFQCQLNAPHPDMWLECHVRDSDGRVVDRIRQIAPRDMARVNFPYLVTSALPAGEYTLALHHAGVEVTSRAISIVGTTVAQPATGTAAIPVASR